MLFKHADVWFQYKVWGFYFWGFRQNNLKVGIKIKWQWNVWVWTLFISTRYCHFWFEGKTAPKREFDLIRMHSNNYKILYRHWHLDFTNKQKLLPSMAAVSLKDNARSSSCLCRATWAHLEYYSLTGGMEEGPQHREMAFLHSFAHLFSNLIWFSYQMIQQSVTGNELVRKWSLLSFVITWYSGLKKLTSLC